jgi:hypothetical protein
MMPLAVLAEDKLGAWVRGPPASQSNVGRSVSAEPPSAESEQLVLSFLRSAPAGRCDSLHFAPCLTLHPHVLSSLDLSFCRFGGVEQMGTAGVRSLVSY